MYLHMPAAMRKAVDDFTKAYNDLKANGMTSPEIDLYSFAEFNTLLGFEDVWDFERRHVETP